MVIVSMSMKFVDRQDLRSAIRPRVLELLNSLLNGDKDQILDGGTRRVDFSDNGGNMTLPELKDWSQVVITARDVMTEYLSDIFTAQNRHLPVTTLPPEILGAIFGYTLAGEPSSMYYQQLYGLMAVSRHWRTLIEKDPSFWTVIDLEYPLDFQDLALRRSAFCPLTLHAARNYLSDTESFLNRVLPEQSRWGAVCFKDAGDSELIESLSLTPVPLLRDLHVVWDSTTEEFDTPITLLADEAPLLRSVTLEFQAVSRWILAPILSRLTRLCLRNKRGGRIITYSDILTTIMQNHNLEELELERIVDLDRGDFAIPSIPANFLHLRELVLKLSADTLCSMILDSIHMPNCTILTLEHPDGHASVPSLQRHLGWMERTCPTLADVLIRGCDILCTIENSTTNHRWRVFGRLASLVATFRWLASVFANVEPNPVMKLKVESLFDAAERYEGREIVDHLWDLPHISELRFSSDLSNIEPLMRILKDPRRDTNSNEHKWCLPNLKELAFGGHRRTSGLELILPMFRSRYGRTADVEPIPEPLPTPFTKLCIRKLFYDNGKAEIEDITGCTVHT